MRQERGLTMLEQEMSVQEIEQWLRERDEVKLTQLWDRADSVRRQSVGNEVHLRGLLEISNYCVRKCTYCGLNIGNRKLERYRMTREEIFECAGRIVKFGYGTVVMQAGEDYGIKTDWLAEIIEQIKIETPLAVTLSMGERSFNDLKSWRQAGTDRYLLRLETSDTALYRCIHPDLGNQSSDRIKILDQLKELGYETGSGVMIGIPGQTYQSLARDIDLFRRLDLDMVGVGPYIENPLTPLGKDCVTTPAISSSDQVPCTENLTYRVVALTRIVCPEANIPSTTALATINRDSGRELGLSRGANVVMPNVTPVDYRRKYEIYPGKACLNETAEVCQDCLAARIASIGRSIARGPGNRKHNSKT
ncbi:MAG: [FeFe] hydrogenase H-cluster radical SAM maturase HydE [Sedimentisphaerales bacterium]|nr:[FeFe] hydrogenase H-cluster radical SAM maturase HydE [Sedimentisphaerales bacterium]